MNQHLVLFRHLAAGYSSGDELRYQIELTTGKGHFIAIFL